MREGDEIRLWLSPRAGKKDVPTVSFILRLESADRGMMYILFHDEKAYSELRYPPKPNELRRRPTAADLAAARDGMGDRMLCSTAAAIRR